MIRRHAVAATPVLDNCLLIAGRVAGPSQTRYSPAGLPIARFLLEHHSQQVEAAIPRDTRCRLPVIACGEALAQAVQTLPVGTLVRIRGFLSRANYRQGEHQLVVHAEQIEILNSVQESRG